MLSVYKGFTKAHQDWAFGLFAFVRVRGGRCYRGFQASGFPSLGLLWNILLGGIFIDLVTAINLSQALLVSLLRYLGRKSALPCYLYLGLNVLKIKCLTLPCFLFSTLIYYLSLFEIVRCKRMSGSSCLYFHPMCLMAVPFPSLKDLYIDRPLPYLIGSKLFMEQEDVGLGELSSEGTLSHQYFLSCLTYLLC